MAETQTPADAAEKAYAAASEQVIAKPAIKPEPVAATAAKPAVAKQAEPAKKASVAKKPATKRAPARKAVVKVKPAAKPIRKAAAKKTISKPTQSTIVQKDIKTMATTAKKTAEDFTSKIQDAVKDARQRAETALEKAQAAAADANEFSRGNLEALVESGKILASGVQAMGKTYAEQVKATLETLQADAKELTSVKSPQDFVALQSKLARKYFDNVVAYNSKSAEAALKLANEAFQPLSSRVSLAVEKVRKAA
jgi:phasin family protein